MGITIKDVANEAGVSVSTVSKVLNDGSTISDATKNHVREVMEKLHYQPNERARNFARQKTNNIVFLAKVERQVAFYNPHMFEIMCGVQQVLASEGYRLNFTGLHNEREIQEYIQNMDGNKSADGIVIHGSATTKEMVQLLVKNEFPHVIIGKPAFESAACWVDTNNRISGQLAAYHLLEYGYRKIAFIGGAKEDEISTNRLKGFHSTIHDFGLLLQNEFIKYGDNSKESGYELTKELFQSVSLPDAIVCENNVIAMGAVKALNEMGIIIPNQIGIVSFDDFPFSRVIEPALTVVDIDVYDMGLQAGKTLLHKIKNPSLQVQSYTTLPRLIVRESTMKVMS